MVHRFCARPVLCAGLGVSWFAEIERNVSVLQLGWPSGRCWRWRWRRAGGRLWLPSTHLYRCGSATGSTLASGWRCICRFQNGELGTCTCRLCSSTGARKQCVRRLLLSKILGGWQEEDGGSSDESSSDDESSAGGVRARGSGKQQQQQQQQRAAGDSKLGKRCRPRQRPGLLAGSNAKGAPGASHCLLSLMSDSQAQCLGKFCWGRSVEADWTIRRIQSIDKHMCDTREHRSLSSLILWDLQRLRAKLGMQTQMGVENWPVLLQRMENHWVCRGRGRGWRRQSFERRHRRRTPRPRVRRSSCSIWGAQCGGPLRGPSQSAMWRPRLPASAAATRPTRSTTASAAAAGSTPGRGTWKWRNPSTKPAARAPARVSTLGRQAQLPRMMRTQPASWTRARLPRWRASAGSASARAESRLLRTRSRCAARHPAHHHRSWRPAAASRWKWWRAAAAAWLRSWSRIFSLTLPGAAGPPRKPRPRPLRRRLPLPRPRPGTAPRGRPRRTRRYWRAATRRRRRLRAARLLRPARCGRRRRWRGRRGRCRGAKWLTLTWRAMSGWSWGRWSARRRRLRGRVRVCFRFYAFGNW